MDEIILAWDGDCIETEKHLSLMPDWGHEGQCKENIIECAKSKSPSGMKVSPIKSDYSNFEPLVRESSKLYQQ